MNGSTGTEHGKLGGDPHLQHHFDTPEQQYTSSKLGMWLFLATELLMFGGLFCAYAIYRGNHADMFAWGSKMMNLRLGAINTLVLITSSFTMALAVRAAQLSQKGRLVLFLSLTLLGGFGFLGIKFVEYRPKFEHGLLWGQRYQPDEAYVLAHLMGTHFDEASHAESTKEATPEPEHAVDLARGKEILIGTCASCHGPDLRGMPKNGRDLLASEFVASKSDDELLAFVKVGRQPFDPANTTGVAMPPRGGNPTLDDDKLRDAIAMLRVLIEETPTSPPPPEGIDSDVAVASFAPLSEEEILPRSVVPPAAAAPVGLASSAATPLAEPANMQHFFGIYFMMTGLHGLHVIAGMVVIAWVLFGALRGRYHADYYTPVDLVGLFWHLVDLIWIFLFPLFYLI